MRKLISILLAAMLVMTCLPVLAEEAPSETVFLEGLGVTLDLSSLSDECANDFVLDGVDVLTRDPYAAVCYVVYCAAPEEELTRIVDAYDAMSAEEQQTWLPFISPLFSEIAYFIVSDAPDMEAMFEATGFVYEEGEHIEEVAALDGWHYYYGTLPANDLLSLYDDPDFVTGFAPTFIAGEYTGERAQAEKEKARRDIELIQAGLKAQLQNGELVAPVDTMGRLIGQTLAFETVDLDGNPVSSADLFRDNKITMVNLWGTWCGNCLNEMAELAQLHIRLQEKGCGIVGLEFEKKPIGEVAETARAVLNENGVTYPNALEPADDPILSQFAAYPTTLFVDSEGQVLAYPIVGALVELYEPTVDALLAGERVETVEAPGAAANGDDRYRVYVCDAEDYPVEGAVIQFCDDTTCAFQPTDASGLAEFNVDVEKVYEVHVLQAPEGFEPDEQTYQTQERYSEVNIVLNRAE